MGAKPRNCQFGANDRVLACDAAPRRYVRRPQIEINLLTDLCGVCAGITEN